MWTAVIFDCATGTETIVDTSKEERTPFAIPDVSAAQFRCALHMMPGKVAGRTALDDAGDAVRAAGGSISIAWEYASTVSRAGVIAVFCQSALALTDAGMDEIMVAAHQISI